MKNFNVVLILLLVSNFALGQCNTYKNFQPGSFIEMAHYDKKGKLSSTISQKVIEISDIPGGKQAEIQSIAKDKDGEEMFKGDINVLCKDGSIFVSMQNMLNHEQWESFDDMEVKFEDGMLEYPNDLNSNSNLKDGTFKAEIYSGTVKIITLTMDVTNRKVIGKETITVPAGTYDCVKITYTAKYKALFSFTYDVTEYWSPEIGIVKSESRKNGKLVGHSELNMYK
jgi:hypothetical protein